MTSLEKRVSELEHLHEAHVDAATMLQLHQEEMEDRSNNLHLRGLPEETGPEDLAATAIAIFRKLPGDSLPQNMEFDRIHRALGPKSQDPNRYADSITTPIRK